MTKVISISGMQANAITAERQRLDDLIHRLVTELCDARRRRNTLAPISRLPPELLVRIFNHCRRPAELSWIPRVAHICSAWRALALSASALWTSPDFDRPEMAQEMLRRSGASPLDVMAGRITEPLKQALCLHSDRIERLHISSGLQDCQIMAKLCTQPAPVLRSLTIHCEIFVNHIFHVGTVFAGNLPSLVELSLKQCQPPSMLPFASQNLQSLHLCEIGVPTDEFHDMLRAAPRLRELSITSSLRDPVTSPYTPSPVHLPALRTLSILKDTPARTDVFLRTLDCSDFEPDDVISISLTRLSDHVTTQEHMSSIGAWVSSSLAPPLTGVFLEKWYPIFYGFTGGRRTRTKNWESCCPVKLKLNLDSYPNPALVGLLFAAFLRGLPWMPITHLGTTGPRIMAPPDGGWRDVFRRAEYVETLHVDAASDTAIMYAVCERGEDGFAVLPRLQKVIVEDMRQQDLLQWWQDLRDRLSLGGQGLGTITLSLRDPMSWEINAYELSTDPFPHEFRTIIQTDLRIRVLWYGGEVDRGNHS